MPKLRHRNSQLRTALRTRWSNENVSEAREESSDNDYMDTAEIDFSDGIIADISDLVEMIKRNSGLKNLSVILYMTLRHFKVKCENIDTFLKDIGLMTCKTSHKWAQIFVKGGYEEYITENRGGKQADSFFDSFPEIEVEAKMFVLEQCSKKSAAFKTSDLVKFIDDKYYETIESVKQLVEPVRSESSCRLDLRRWGAKFVPNSQRPYFEGHERADVVKYREEFISYFLSRKNNYYTLTDDEQPMWNIPTKNPPTILLCHDESTFRSGEVSPKRWIFDEKRPFFSKGHGRSLMISDFIVLHPSGPFFQLNDNEYKKAIKKYKNLLDDTDVNYAERSATASVNVGVDGYFDNDTILAQFERLFQLMEFKDDYRNHVIEVLVDNARTHTSKQYSLFDFGKGIYTRCPVDKIQFIDENGATKSIDCYFECGPNKNKSKGLVEICKELDIKLHDKCKLHEIRDILSKHRAFQNVSKLEQLANKYKIKIIFSPKYHCECNPIEGLWCNMKLFVRQRSDQTFDKMIRLISDARAHFVDKKIALKLFRRFWRTLEAYAQGQTYTEVLQLYFSQLCRGTVKYHRKITNANLDA
ncbi:unnamed protein product [Didymodactylos carnosus]|uniref:Uncharacterized protein n=1 Tax=Didymodactylos carnosus TaxID=1234261 RepID=A0A813XBW6_9BILA|nr:unnamed protein product [Didymodactylos carnosus]CAF3650268.1 unnamed protein product [Didymodactylos carnosus]